MKKKFNWKGLCTVVVIAFFAYQYCVPQKAKFFMANVEALSSDSKDEGGASNKWPCWSDVKDGDGVWVCGNPCVWKEHKKAHKGKSNCYSN